MRQPIDVADSTGAAMIAIHDHLMHHRIGDQRAIAGGNGVRNSRQRRVEIRTRGASPFARTAVMAG